MILPSRPFGVVASTQTIMLKKALAAAYGFVPGDFDFQNITAGSDSYANGNTVNFIKSGSLFILVESVGSGGAVLGGLVGATTNTGYGSYNAATGVLRDPTEGLSFYNAYYAVVEITSGDSLYFYAQAGPDPFNGDLLVSIYDSPDTDKTLLDTFYVYKGGCFLTTAVVEYMGLLDNGPELTAVRKLRNHYRDVPGYAELIQEYYTNSRAIIDAINASKTPSIEYDYIYNTVIAVMNHVNAEEWQQAHDLYLAMYNDLKSRYLG